MRNAVVRTATPAKFRQSIEIGPHALTADEQKEVGGDDTGPAPHDFLLAALGACTSMTLKMYAERKGIPLEKVEVHLSQEKKDDGHHITRRITLVGALDADQRARLLEIANKCPVHKTLTGKISIDSSIAD
jgi:putative redox protein